MSSPAFSRENEPASASRPKILLSVDEVLRQIARFLIGSPKVLVDAETTVSHAIETAATKLQDYDRRVVFSPPRSKAQREAARRLALAPPPTRSLAIRTNTDAPLPDPAPLSKEQRAALKKAALEMDFPSGDPYIFNLSPTLADAYLPSLMGTFVLNGINNDGEGPSAAVTTDKVYFDTGAHSSIMSDDLVDDEFKTYLRTEENAPYTMNDTSKVQVSAMLKFSNNPFQFEFILLVVPLDKMPNRFSGVLLGQRTFIDRLQIEMIPRSLLLARKQDVAEDSWGDLLIKAFVDIYRDIHEF